MQCACSADFVLLASVCSGTRSKEVAYVFFSVVAYTS